MDQAERISVKDNDLVRDGLAPACAERAYNASFEARPIRKFRARLQYLVRDSVARGSVERGASSREETWLAQGAS